MYVCTYYVCYVCMPDWGSKATRIQSQGRGLGADGYR